MGAASRKGGKKTLVDQKDSALAIALSVATASEEKSEAKASKIQRPTSTTETTAGTKGRKAAKEKKSRNRVKLDATKAQLLNKRKDKVRARKDEKRQRNVIPSKETVEFQSAGKPPRKRVSFA
ncbi:hypothetical protein PENSPDRAFT_41662 [Peniophora sp. CONT]|nr:hypothetical protein PENSPDRAFT_41662 [Peniophora sp. CONT]